MKVFYLSLVRGLLGYYVKFSATDIEVVRGHAYKYFGKMWCSVYPLKEFNEIKIKYNIKIINEDNPIMLNGSSDWK